MHNDKNVVLIECVLHRHLYVAVRAHSLGFDEIFSVVLEMNDIHFKA